MGLRLFSNEFFLQFLQQRHFGVLSVRTSPFSSGKNLPLLDQHGVFLHNFLKQVGRESFGYRSTYTLTLPPKGKSGLVGEKMIRQLFECLPKKLESAY